MSKQLTQNQKRCQDCACLVVKNGQWCCEECFCQTIEEIDDCPEGVTVEEVEIIDEKAKNVKIVTGARAEKPSKTVKPRTIKTSDEKQALFSDIFENLQTIYGENVQVLKENKLICLTINGKVFKIDLIEQRKPKN